MIALQAKRRGTPRAAGRHRQVSLPWSKAVGIALRGIRTRLARSLITTAGVVLAIAFFTFTLISETIGEQGGARSPFPRQHAARATAASPSPPASRSQKIWLAGLSLLVCVVGIANAMLMSVTERYREIGTMKCLGALDVFILKLFMLESGFLGFAGACLGAVVGGAIAILSRGVSQGPGDLMHLPWPAILKCLLLSIMVGLMLCMAGAFYPSWVASRMAPAEAMRMEV